MTLARAGRQAQHRPDGREEGSCTYWHTPCIDPWGRTAGTFATAAGSTSAPAAVPSFPQHPSAERCLPPGCVLLFSTAAARIGHPCSVEVQDQFHPERNHTMLDRTILALAALVTASAFDASSAEAQQWAPAGGAYATVSQRPVAYQPLQPTPQVRYQASAYPAAMAGAPAGFCSGCGNTAAYCNCAAGACVNGMCPQGCHCANGRCQCVNGQCQCENGECGCICPPGACERGECMPGCPCPCCNGSRSGQVQWQAHPAGLSGAAPHAVSRPISHTTLMRPVIADAPARMVTASL
jgi:hypothetical protein